MTRLLAVGTAWAVCLGALSAVPAAAADPSLFTNGARTLHEALDMRSPESTAAAFLAAWRRRDYVTVFVLLSPEGQRGWTNQVASTFTMETLFPRHGDAVMAQTSFGRQDDGEHASDIAMIFDEMLVAAGRLGALPFQAAPDAMFVLTSLEDRSAIFAVAATPGQAAFQLRLQRMNSGRWKVDQILLPGANPALKPWGF